MRQITTRDGKTWRLEQWHFTQKVPAMPGTTILLFWDQSNNQVRVALIPESGVAAMTDAEILEAYDRSLPPESN